MRRVWRVVLPVVTAMCLIALVALWLEGRNETRTLPQSLCGTRVSAGDLKPLIPAEGEITERNDVDRRDPQPASWCSLNVNGKTALDLRFAWHDDEVDPVKVAGSVKSVSYLELPERATTYPRTAVGNNGAIATAPCRTKGGAYFTLSVLLKGTNLTDTGYRNDIEKFMRAYFPATVKTLHCR
ncbi:hypothetical protein [Streptomyces flaveolus]|uniref:hypothetical protein n=1 Tax=Streptomyces flaveolus TaxID=67297 RepID=UPI003823D4D1